MLDPFGKLVLSGFPPLSAARLVALRRRYEQGEFRELTDEEKRLLFGRWLVEHGRLREGGLAFPPEPRAGGPLNLALATPASSGLGAWWKRALSAMHYPHVLPRAPGES